MSAALRYFGWWALLVIGVSAALAQVAPDDPRNQVAQQQTDDLQRAVAPYIAAARATYPSARTRFLNGLPAGQNFFVVTRLVDPTGHWEQVFIRAQTIEDGIITGIISSDVGLVKGFKAGQPYSFKERDLIDWVITKPDGSEEGNVVGKFLERYRQ